MATLGTSYTSLMSDAKNYTSQALGNISDAKNASNSAIANARNAYDTANGAASKSYGLVSQAVNAASGMTPYITKVGNAATQVNQTAQGLTQYEAMLKDYSQKLAANSQPMIDYGTGLIGDATALRNLDPNATGLVGSYVGNLALYSPDRYVAQAAADAQSSADNAYSQMLRKQSRTGQTASGSANSNALAQEWARTTAALLAGSKTRAYQTGLNEQTTALRNALSDALQMGNAGVSAVSAGNTALSSAASAASGAASTVSQKAQLESTAGQMYASAAGLQAQQASAYNSAAATNNQTANLQLSAAQQVTNAFQSAVSASLQIANMQYNMANDASASARQQQYLDSLGSSGTSSSGMSTYEKNKAQRGYNGKAYTFSNDALSQVGSVSSNLTKNTSGDYVGTVTSGGGGRALYEYEKM